MPIGTFFTWLAASKRTMQNATNNGLTKNFTVNNLNELTQIARPGTLTSELDTSTIARMVPMNLDVEMVSRLRTILKLTYIKLNSQMPCPPRSTVSVNQGCCGSFFTLNTRVVPHCGIMAATIPTM